MCGFVAGEKFGADGDAATKTALQAIQDAAAEETKQRLAEKAAKKAAFNAEYDVGELAVLSAVDIKAQGTGRGRGVKWAGGFQNREGVRQQ